MTSNRNGCLRPAPRPTRRCPTSSRRTRTPCAEHTPKIKTRRPRPARARLGLVRLFDGRGPNTSRTRSLAGATAVADVAGRAAGVGAVEAGVARRAVRFELEQSASSLMVGAARRGVACRGRPNSSRCSNRCRWSGPSRRAGRRRRVARHVSRPRSSLGARAGACRKLTGARAMALVVQPGVGVVFGSHDERMVSQWYPVRNPIRSCRSRPLHRCRSRCSSNPRRSPCSSCTCRRARWWSHHRRHRDGGDDSRGRARNLRACRRSRATRPTRAACSWPADFTSKNRSPKPKTPLTPNETAAGRSDPTAVRFLPLCPTSS